MLDNINEQNKNQEASLNTMDYDPELDFLLANYDLRSLERQLQTSSPSSIADPQPGPSGVKRQKVGHKKKITTTTSKPSTTTTTTMSSEMDTDGNDMIVPASEAPQESGHNASSDGGFDSAQGPKTYIDKPLYLYKHGLMHFKVKHRIRVFAIPMTWPTAAGPTPIPTNVRYVITPMAYIPVDKIYFYMSSRQFALIPPGSYIDSCNVTVDLLNSSTSFETGASTTDTSTLSHIRTGLIGVDLDKKLRGSVVNTLTIPASMIPTIASAGEDFQEFVNLEYGGWPGSAAPFPTWDSNTLPGSSYGIQFNKYDYLCMYQQNQAGYTADGFGAANSMGHEYFQSQVEEFNINDKLWDRIVNYNYKFKSAPIGARFKPVELKSGNFTQEVGASDIIHLQRSVTNVNGAANVNYSEAHVDHTFNNTHLVTYGTDTMEKGASNSKGSAPFTPARQPTLYIGMRAIPKTTPATGTVRRTNNWVNADMTLDITATMTVRTNDYPNRFTQPGIFNVSLENMELGSAANPAVGIKDITFGLRHN